MKTKRFYLIGAILIAATVTFAYQNQESAQISDLALENIEAISGSEGGASGASGAKCPNGCSSIGWGWEKILECDCNYDHFSCCDRWGC